MDANFLELLRCPRCRSSFAQAGDQLTCTSCNSSYSVQDGVPILWADGKRSSTLENIDYDALQPINRETIALTSNQWEPIIRDLFADPVDALELGAGTGILTEALVTSPSIRSVVASDVSRKFMGSVHARLSGNPRFGGAIVCDANEAVFPSQKFDLVVGRSVLHHFLHYELVLRNVHSFLKPGGAAIFFEPVIEGKAAVSLAFAMILHAAEASPELTLSKQEWTRIKVALRHQTKQYWYPQIPEELAKLEDKYIFSTRDLQQLATKIGFSEVTIRDSQKVDPTYWTHVERTLLMLGVDASTIQKFRWVGTALQDSYFSTTYDVPSPMVYFIFRR